MTDGMRKAAALTMAVLCVGAFAFAVGSMAWALATGMQSGLGTLTGWRAPAADALLVLQFPLVHSYLLSHRGRPALQRLSPVGHGKALAVSTFALVASFQLLLTFWAWTPSHVVWHEPRGAFGAVQWFLFGASWLFLNRALYDAGLGVQTGSAGWWALLRGKPVNYGTLPTRGLFSACRQPIYLGFALVLWTSPEWTPDWLVLSVGWSAYCILGPRLKEARWERFFGEKFLAYRERTPYMIPRFRR